MMELLPERKHAKHLTYYTEEYVKELEERIQYLETKLKEKAEYKEEQKKDIQLLFIPSNMSNNDIIKELDERYETQFYTELNKDIQPNFIPKNIPTEVLCDVRGEKLFNGEKAETIMKGGNKKELFYYNPDTPILYDTNGCNIDTKIEINHYNGRVLNWECSY